MYKVEYTNKFEKDYKILKKRGLDTNKLKNVVKKLANGEELDKKYNDHYLNGKYDGFKECHIAPDWLLFYLIKDKCLTLTLIRTGTHSDLF